MENLTTYQNHIYKSLDLKLGKVDNVTRFTNPPKFGEDRDTDLVPPRGGDIFKSRAFYTFLFLFFLFPDTCTTYTHEPIFTHTRMKDADWLEEVLSNQAFFDIFTFWGSLSPKIPRILPPVGK